jgi:hypothetical protein
MLDFLTKHFAVLSAGLTGLAATLAMIFVFAYLSVFDWNLIWIIEYPDIIKFCLIGIGIASGSAVVTFWWIEDIYHWTTQKASKFWKYIVACLIVGPVANVLIAWFTRPPDRFWYTVAASFASLVLVGLSIEPSNG